LDGRPAIDAQSLIERQGSAVPVGGCKSASIAGEKPGFRLNFLA
jgi:hypothetical protein